MSSILDIYKQNKQPILDKSIRQILGFTGDGVLRNHNETSQEFRNFLSIIPTEHLVKYASECLDDKFTDSGLVLQDIVNQAGKRLGFTIEYGLYQGSKNTIGYDGIWDLNQDGEIIVEVKTTDAYRINLDHIYSYKHRLLEQNRISKNSSILIVVGRKDTGDLEAQIRGSRYGWDFRLISVESLMKLVNIKENLNDEKTIKQISEILRPLEFTRLDKLIEIVFETTQDIHSESVIELLSDPETIIENNSNLTEQDNTKQRTTPVSFQDKCLSKIEEKFNIDLIRMTRSGYKAATEDLGFLCSISKQHEGKTYSKYWFAIHPHQRDFLEKFNNAYCIYGCGSEDTTFAIPFNIIKKQLDYLWTTERNNSIYWHIVIYQRNGKFEWQIPKQNTIINLEEYKI